MTAEEIKKILAILGLLALSACGGSTSSQSRGASLAVTILNSKSFSPTIEHGRVQTYRVQIEGEGIAEPIVAEFSGDADEGLIENVPAGAGRFVSVLAINGNDVTIRAGESENIEIGDGENTVDVALDAVPIFTNLTDNSSIDNTRLVFRLFSDPGNPVQVEEIGGSAPEILADASTNQSLIWPSGATGLGHLSPPLFLPGPHTFKVRDVITGRFSEVSIVLVDGAKRKPAPLAAAVRTLAGVSQKAGGAAQF